MSTSPRYSWVRQAIKGMQEKLTQSKNTVERPHVHFDVWKEVRGMIDNNID